MLVKEEFLSDCWNVDSVQSESQSWSGSKFQTVGPATMNTWRPSVLHRWRGMVSKQWRAENVTVHKTYHNTRQVYRPVFACRSLPAKSTRFSLAALMCSSPLSSVSQHSRCMVKIEWLREESAFISVAPTERFFHPRSITRSQSVTFLHGCIDSPTIVHQQTTASKITLTKCTVPNMLYRRVQFNVCYRHTKSSQSYSVQPVSIHHYLLLSAYHNLTLIWTLLYIVHCVPRTCIHRF